MKSHREKASHKPRRAASGETTLSCFDFRLLGSKIARKSMSVV